MRPLLVSLALFLAACGQTPTGALDSSTAETESRETSTQGGMCSLGPEMPSCGLWGCGETQLCGASVEFAVCYEPPCALEARQLCAFEALREGTPGLLVFEGLGGDSDESVYAISVRAQREVVRQTLAGGFDEERVLQAPNECALVSAQYFADCISGVNSYDECAFGSWTQGCAEVVDACG